MDEDSDTRSSFPSPFKQESVRRESEETIKRDAHNIQKCLNVESNVFFHHDEIEHAVGFDDSTDSSLPSSQPEIHAIGFDDASDSSMPSSHPGSEHALKFDDSNSGDQGAMSSSITQCPSPPKKTREACILEEQQIAGPSLTSPVSSQESTEASVNWVNKKIFYLDYDERSDEESLASQLIQLGGHVVTFLSKRVDFVVTKAGKNKTKLLPSVKPVTYQSRALTMVVKSKTKRVEGLSRVSEIAKRWNIKILEYEYASRVIKQLLEHVNIDTSETTKVNNTKGHNVTIRKLKHPFIKVEDMSGLYQPLYREFKKFPSINFESELGSCPFDYPETFQGRNSLKNGENRTNRFCECCNETYTDLEEHLASRKHRDFASNDSNYARIDKFIIENGLDIDSFKAKMHEKHNRQ